METTSSEPIPAHRAAVLPYPPSLPDRIMRGVRRLPLPYGLTYLLLFLLTVLIHHVVDWADGSVPVFHFFPFDCFFPLLIFQGAGIVLAMAAFVRRQLPGASSRNARLHRVDASEALHG